MPSLTPDEGVRWERAAMKAAEKYLGAFLTAMPGWRFVECTRIGSCVGHGRTAIDADSLWSPVVILERRDHTRREEFLLSSLEYDDRSFALKVADHLHRTFTARGQEFDPECEVDLDGQPTVTFSARDDHRYRMTANPLGTFRIDMWNHESGAWYPFSALTKQERSERIWFIAYALATELTLREKGQ